MAPLPHDEATATVFVDGLGVCCYNRADKKWDLAFLHDDQEECEHRLVLLVDGNSIVDDDVLQSASLIEIIAENPLTKSYPGSPNGFFDLGPLSHRERQEVPTHEPSTDEEQNFRWTINLEDQGDVPHGHVTLRKPDFPLTRAYIHNGVFYTAKRSDNNLLLTLNTENPNDMHDPAEIQAHTLGKTNDRIAADIFCDPDNGKGKIIIRVNGTVEMEVPHRAGSPWEIRLTNLCESSGSTGATFEKGDFHHFYDVLKGFTRRHAIWGPPTALLSGRTDCDTVFMSPDTQTLDPLFEPDPLP